MAAEPHLWSEAPLAGVGIALHDDAFDLGHDAVVTGGDDGRGHQGDGWGVRETGGVRKTFTSTFTIQQVHSSPGGGAVFGHLVVFQPAANNRLGKTVPLMV